MFQIAGLFILAETLMYYAILQVWLTTWNFIAISNQTKSYLCVIANKMKQSKKSASWTASFFAVTQLKPKIFQI